MVALGAAWALTWAFAATAVGVPTRTVHFSGYDWTVKSSTRKVGPGPNFFSTSTDNVWVDSHGDLHLKITKVQKHWYVAEVVNTASLGYGTYTWVLDSRVDDLDTNAVLGMFTYNENDPAFANREIDIEASRWGKPKDPTNAQFVVQPAATNGNLRRITQGSGVPATFSFTWTATSLSWTAPGASPRTYVYRGTGRPPSGGEQPRINLWLYRGRQPRGRQPSRSSSTPSRSRPREESPAFVVEVGRPLRSKIPMGGEEIPKPMPLESKIVLKAAVSPTPCRCPEAVPDVRTDEMGCHRRRHARHPRAQRARGVDPTRSVAALLVECENCGHMISFNADKVPGLLPKASGTGG